MAETTRPSSLRFHGLLIENLEFTDVKLGRGTDATVFKVDWNGTRCAAKRLHDILREDQSPGGVDKLIGNLEAECLTWSKLRHPGVVQFLGVYFERSSRLPVLVMEKMDTSLRAYLEGHSKEEFPLNLKAFVLRQVAQALAYLHSQNPPLVHHDLSPNNVLLNVVSFVTKVSDFGMSRAINPSALSRKSSIKGTLAFMAPEALHDPPRYNESLDVFSFGNIIISTLTHECMAQPWSSQEIYDGDQHVVLSELHLRDHYVIMFTSQEKQLFLPIVTLCLQNQASKRPSSVMLVRELRRIESSLPTGSHVAAPIEHLRQQLSAKEEECRQKDKELREKEKVTKEREKKLRKAVEEKDAVIRDNEELIRKMEKALKDKDESDVIQSKIDLVKGRDQALRHLDKVIGEKKAEVREKDEVIKVKEVELRKEKAELQHLQTVRKGKHPLRDWRKLGERHQGIVKHSPEGGRYNALAVNSEGLVAVTDEENGCVHLLNKEFALVRSIGKGKLSKRDSWSKFWSGRALSGVAFDLKGNVWVADSGKNNIVKLSQDDRLLQTIHHAGSESDCFSRPLGMSVSAEGQIYICDNGNYRVVVHDETGKFLFGCGSVGRDSSCFRSPRDVAFGSDGLVYVSDEGNKRVSVWTKEGTFKRAFQTKYAPLCIAATSDNHLLITSFSTHFVMVYTLEGKLVHEFGGEGSHPGRFKGPAGICVDDNGVVYVVDDGNNRVQVF